LNLSQLYITHLPECFSYHKGDILVFSEIDEGTSFHVYLPIIKSREKFVEKVSKEIIGGTELVMIVDDEPAITEMVKTILENFGYKTEIFTNGSDALNAFNLDPEKYDILITDLTMPQITGLDLAAEIHKLKPKLPVLIMTGFGDNLTDDTQQRHGVDKVIGKPIVIKELTASIRSVLDK